MGTSGMIDTDQLIVQEFDGQLVEGRGLSGDVEILHRAASQVPIKSRL